MLFVRFGCKVNQYETNAMIQEFINHQYEIVEFNQEADIYIVNTCTVTNMADKKSRQMLRRVKEISPNSLLIAVGCYAQVAKEELVKLPEIDLILGNNEKKNVFEIIEKYQRNIGQKEEVSDVIQQCDFVDFGTVTYTEKTRAVIKVQDGCDRYCSYCIIPYARGRVRSRKPDSVIKEITEIAQKGIKEVVITGIHIASYGKDFKEENAFIRLLEEINAIEGIQRIRLGSLEPTLMTEALVNRLAKLEKVCNHFHLSLQSGCNDTLKRMNRKYTIEEFKEGVARLRNAYSEVFLTTDIIVGFPGETDEEFNQTYDFLKEIAFYKMHIFKYSPRKGTKAAIMPNQINGNIKEQRSRKLIQLSDENEIRYNKEYIGKQIDVLFEEENYHENDKEYIKGHTTNYIVVKIEKSKVEKPIANTVQKIAITDYDGVELIGKVINS